MHTVYSALPESAQCRDGARTPLDYPPGFERVLSARVADLQAYHDACSQVGARCGVISGASLGFAVYRPLAVTECQERALSLHGNTILRRAVETFFPDRPLTALTTAQQTGLAHVIRRWPL